MRWRECALSVYLSVCFCAGLLRPHRGLSLPLAPVPARVGLGYSRDEKASLYFAAVVRR